MRRAAITLAFVAALGAERVHAQSDSRTAPASTTVTTRQAAPHLDARDAGDAGTAAASPLDDPAVGRLPSPDPPSSQPASSSLPRDTGGDATPARTVFEDAPGARTSPDDAPGARTVPEDALASDAPADAGRTPRNPFSAKAGPAPAPSPLLQNTVGDAADVEPGELLVWHADLAAALAFAAQVDPLGYSVRRRMQLDGLGIVQTTVSLPGGTSVAAARARLGAAFPDLLVDANHRYRLLGADETELPYRLVGWTAEAAACARDGRVGVIDTLADTTHPVFTGRDVVIHGVLPAGTEAAKAAHGTAVAARLAELLPGAAIRVVGVFRQRDRGITDTTAEWLVQALDWLLGERVQAVNLSLGGPANGLLAAAIERVLAPGIGVVAAVGDGGPDSEPVYPSALPGVIGVTAIDREGRVYRRARRGDEVDLAAPGVDVPQRRPDGSLIYLTGTSYAAPFATAARLLAGSDEALTAAARDLGAPGRDPVFGAGLVRFEPLCAGVLP